MRVALVSMTDLSKPDLDEAPLLGALRAAGCEARTIAWDAEGDPAQDPSGFDLCLLRATWNYYRRPEAFLGWLDHAARTSRLLNDLEVVRWNMHKRYLLQLQQAGVEVVPTACFPRGTEVSLGEELEARGWPELVIKPAISAGSWQTRRFGPATLDQAEAFLRKMLGERDMLVQPFLPEVEGGGELALVWIDGVTTHAVTKAPRFHGEPERVTSAPITPRQKAFVDQVLTAAGQGQHALYARVDAVARADGSLLLSELELIEPSLFFRYSAAALARFVAAALRGAAAAERS